MKIAVLMSTYNGHKFLNKQLQSIAEQTMISDIKLYIRDDGSSDNTLEIVDGWKDKIDLKLFKGENLGPAKSFWTLFMDTNIQADYYAFCDQDDLWDTDKIEKAINKIRRFDDTPALYCSNCRIIDSNNNVITERMNKDDPVFTIISQLVCGTTQGCAMVFNKRLRDYVVKNQIKQLPMHDLVVMTYAILAGEVVYDPSPSFSYRVHENNVVAKSGKNLFKKIKYSFSSWFSKKNKHKISDFAEQLYSDNEMWLDESTKKYIKMLISSRYNILNRFKIIINSKTKANNKRAEISFKVRVLIGLV